MSEDFGKRFINEAVEAAKRFNKGAAEEVSGRSKPSDADAIAFLSRANAALVRDEKRDQLKEGFMLTVQLFTGEAVELVDQEESDKAREFLAEVIEQIQSSDINEWDKVVTIMFIQNNIFPRIRKTATSGDEPRLTY
jgi:hypothetical protein